MVDTTVATVIATTVDLDGGIEMTMDAWILLGVGSVVILALLLLACVVLCFWNTRSNDYKKTQVGTSTRDNPYFTIEVPAEQEGGPGSKNGGFDPDARLSIDLQKILEESLKRKAEGFFLDKQRLQLDEPIGSGKFGVVYKGRLTDPNRQHVREVAVKTVHGDVCTKEDVESFMEEVTLMKGFKHQNVLSLLGIVDIDNKPYAVLPFMELGDLKNYIAEKERSFVIQDLLCFAAQIADGMAYLSEQGFVHRDLAARNCMVTAEDVDKKVVKIADFGLSKDLFDADYYKVNDKDTPLPVKWMAMESLAAPYIFSSKSDVWSFGVLVWELMTRGRTPYSYLGMDALTLIEHIKSGNKLSKPNYCPDEIYEIMVRCWHGEPALRPTFQQLSKEILEMMTGRGHSKPFMKNRKLSKKDKTKKKAKSSVKYENTKKGQKQTPGKRYNNVKDIEKPNYENTM